MRKFRVIGMCVCALLCMFFLASAGEARVLKGHTRSYIRKLNASAVATDGFAVTARVEVKKKIETKAGTLYIGKYRLHVAEGEKVMIVFSRARNNGTQRPVTVARFAANASGSPRTTQFNVTPPLVDDVSAIYLGRIRVMGKLAIPSANPLKRVDTDGDEISDFSDPDDDDDGIDDDLDDDADDNGIFDEDEDLNTDDDSRPDVVDVDDDDDGLKDRCDLDDDGDGIDDWDGDTDSDHDTVADSDDPDDDNDGISDIEDDDLDGDGILDDSEQDSDDDGIPDDVDDDDDDDGIPDSLDDDNDDDGTSDQDDSEKEDLPDNCKQSDDD